MKIDGLVITLKQGSQEIKSFLKEDGTVIFDYPEQQGDGVVIHRLSIKGDVLLETVKILQEHAK